MLYPRSNPIAATTAPANPTEPPAPGQILTPEEPPVTDLCCGDKTACSSGRTCRPGTCEARLPNRWWWIRISGVASGSAGVFPNDVSKSNPRAWVCLRRAGAQNKEVCAPLAQVAKTEEGDRVHRLRVHRSDLEGGKIEIRLEDEHVMLASGRSATNLDGIKTSVLCKGLKLYVGPRATATAIVNAYLDDR